MDGRSIVPLLIDPSDPAVLPATKDHIFREIHGAGAQNKTGPWRTFHPIEFIAVRSLPCVTLVACCTNVVSTIEDFQADPRASLHVVAE
jgi:hypothetical protein